MRILSLGGTQFIKCFRQMGIAVRALVNETEVQHPDDIGCTYYSNLPEFERMVKENLESFAPDLVFQGDHSGPLIHTGLQSCSVPTVWYAIDTHLHSEWHKHYAVIFDKVFCAQQNLVTTLSTYHPDVSWLPLYCSRTSPFLPWEERIYPVSFVGTCDRSLNPERVWLLEEISRRVPVHVVQGDYVPIYSRSKIVINQSVHDDLNLRFFEGPGSGALLVSQCISHSMQDILKPDEDYLIYERGNVDDLERKLRYALEHEDEACAMAMRAYRKIHDHHLEKHRAETVLDWFRNAPAKSKKADQGFILSHLSRASDLVAVSYNQAHITTYFSERAHWYAMSAKQYQSGSNLALLVLADQALRREQVQIAQAYLSEIDERGDCSDFRLRFFVVKILAEAMAGSILEAARVLKEALSIFPENEELQQILVMVNRALNR